MNIYTISHTYIYIHKNYADIGGTICRIKERETEIFKYLKKVATTAYFIREESLSESSYLHIYR